MTPRSTMEAARGIRYRHTAALMALLFDCAPGADATPAEVALWRDCWAVFEKYHTPRDERTVYGRRDLNARLDLDRPHDDYDAPGGLGDG